MKFYVDENGRWCMESSQQILNNWHPSPRFEQIDHKVAETTVSSMIEKVARALAATSGHKMDDEPNVAGRVLNDLYRGMARAAIEAMRDPTDDMLRVDVPQDILTIYEAMIDAALNKGE